MIRFFEFTKDGTTRKYKSEFNPKSREVFDNKTKNQVTTDARILVNNRLIRLEINDVIVFDNENYRVITVDSAEHEAWNIYWLVKQDRSARVY